MEGGSDENLGNGIGGSRWNPTKEQINMLESLYRQGLRTPTAEQIQQITARLRDFGHIEGKNVFYWFQNHKARQRQKQKQETFAFYNRFLHATTPVFPPYQNVVCSPCYISPPRNDHAVFYQQHPKVPLPTASGSLKRSRLIPEMSINDSSKQQQQQPTIQKYNNNLHCIYTARNSSSHHQETLDLFPIHPTGILESSRNIDEAGHDQNEIKNPSFCAEKERDANNDSHPFFDFFGGN
ncbi:hypothetical protein C2S52_009139 [Perilla frutescens var. hirtella]|nr:hypothetical protein C2S51_017339 [Perilla frutescens var. frutescens]KAH6784180.1 hypothetical protein C2S52_009139 [Perilla frutescens var. hirtella]